MIVIAITTEDINNTSTNPNGLFHRQTSNQEVIIVAGTIPKVEVSNRAPVLRASATIFTLALFHLDVRGRRHLYRGPGQPYTPRFH